MIETVGDLVRELSKYPESTPIAGDADSGGDYPMCIHVSDARINLKVSEWAEEDEGDEAVVIRVSY